MSETREVEMRAECYGAAERTIKARYLCFDAGERRRRAAKIGLPLFGLALVSLPIPAWHLFAVPGFLIASLVLGTRALREHERLEALDGPCPACGKATLEPPTRLRLPHTLRCGGCGEFVKLTQAG